MSCTLYSAKPNSIVEVLTTSANVDVDKSNVAQIMEVVFDREQKIVGKAENIFHTCSFFFHFTKV